MNKIIPIIKIPEIHINYSTHINMHLLKDVEHTRVVLSIERKPASL